MIRRPPRSTRTDTLFPYTTLFRSILTQIRFRPQEAVDQISARAMYGDAIETHRLGVFGASSKACHHIGDFAFGHRAGRFIHAGDIFGRNSREPSRRSPDSRRSTGRRFWKGTGALDPKRSEEHTSDIQSLLRNSYAVFCLKKKK